MKIKLLYIIGAYRAATHALVNANIQRAWHHGLEVAHHCGGQDNAQGFRWYPMIPHCNTAHMDGAAPDEYFLEGTLETMRRCEAVLVLPGYTTSKGSLREIEEARRLGIPVFFSLDELLKHPFNGPQDIPNLWPENLINTTENKEHTHESEG